MTRTRAGGRHAAPSGGRQRRRLLRALAGVLALAAVVWVAGASLPAGLRHPLTAAGSQLGALAKGMLDPRPPAAVGTSPAARSAADDTISRLVERLPSGSVSVAAVDTVTGARYGYGARSGMTMGSVAKLLILEAFLLQEQDAGRAAGQTADQALSAMMEYSDNDAADELYEQLGGQPALTAAAERLGLTATAVPPDDPWGLGTTSARDQLTLLRQLVSTPSPLSPASRAYALTLMRDVEADQRWGVGITADEGTSFANKNGWLDLDADDGRWLVNSVGVVTVRGHRVLMAVLTQHGDDFQQGVALNEALAQAAATGLGLG